MATMNGAPSGAETNGHGVEWRADALGREPGLYRPDLWRKSSDIGIAGYRQIYLWPLALHADAIAAAEDVADLMDDVAKTVAADPAWRAVDDLRDHLPPSGEEDDVQRYAEFVYFHDFVQANLFAKVESVGPAPIRLFRRTSVASARASIAGVGFEFAFARLNLYLFSTGAAMLAAEIDFGVDPLVGEAGAKRPLSLRDVQLFADRFRRAYPPFFSLGKGATVRAAGLVPDCVELFDDRGAAIADAPDFNHMASFAEVAATTDRRRAPPLFRHWRELVRPLAIVGDDDAAAAKEKDRPFFRQIIDERIPAMSFVSLKPAPGQSDAEAVLSVQRGDWARLCHCDFPGKAAMPYSGPFLDDFEAKHCYDRYFPHPSGPPYYASRHLFAGYHYALVGAGGFMDGTLVHHFRRHYFQLGLAAHMEVASLLALSSRVTNAVRDLNIEGRTHKAGKKFAGRMQAIGRDFLEFVHLFRFTGLSNQLQPTEMLALWRERLGLRDLFDDVKAEIETANNFLFAIDQARQAEAAARLNVIAVVGVVLGLVFSALGMNVLVDAEGGWRLLGLLLFAFAGVALFGAWALGRGDGNARNGPALAALWMLTAAGALLWGFGDALARLLGWMSGN